MIDALEFEPLFKANKAFFAAPAVDTRVYVQCLSPSTHKTCVVTFSVKTINSLITLGQDAADAIQRFGHEHLDVLDLRMMSAVEIEMAQMEVQGNG